MPAEATNTSSGVVYVIGPITTSNVTFSGIASGADGTAAAPSYTFTSDLDTGMYRISANRLGLSVGGVLTVDILSGTLQLYSTNDGAGNYSGLFQGFSGGNRWFVGGVALGTGTVYPLSLSDKVRVETSGSLTATTDNSYDLGAAGATRFRTGYFGTSLLSPVVNATTGFQQNGTIFTSTTAPTLTAGFGSSPSVVANNGTIGFTINVGTGGVASTGTITLPAAPTGWVAVIQDVTTPASFITSQTGGTTTTVTVTNYSRTTGSAIAWAASDILRVSCFPY